MLYCRNCNVSVNGDKRCCPLCQSELNGTPDCKHSAYPYIAAPKYSKNFLLRFISFIAIVSIVICLAINMMIPTEIWWSFFAAGGIICAWIAASVAISYRKRLLKNITWQLFILTSLAVIWDSLTGWHGWSIDYIIPCSCVISMISMFVLSKILKTPTNEYIIYLIMDGIYGIIPVIFIFTGVLNVVYPSAICVACSLISISALLLFEGKNMKSEIARKLHL